MGHRRQCPLSRFLMTAKLKGFGRRPFAGDAGAGRGAGVRKPRKEETAGRKRRGLAGRELWGFGVADGSPKWRRGGGQPLLSSGANTTRFFGGEDASGGCGRSGWREFAEVVRTSCSCSGARGEAKAISIARQETPR